MRVVLDTNVIIAGLYSRNGASFQLLNMAIRGELDYALTPLIALEYEGKLNEKIRTGLLQLNIEECLTIIKALIENSIQIERPYVLGPILIDESDNKIIECAVSGECDIIITFNKRHFPMKVIEKFNLIVLTPGEFYEREVKSK